MLPAPDQKTPAKQAISNSSSTMSRSNMPMLSRPSVLCEQSFANPQLHLVAELLDTLVVLAWHKSKGNNTRDVHLGAKDLHVEAKLDSNALDVLETLLVVGASTTDPDGDLVLDEKRSNLTEGTDDTLECGGDLTEWLAGKCQMFAPISTYVGEVGNTTTDEEDLALGVLWRPEHKIKDSACVVEGLSLGGCARVFTVVGKLGGETGRCNGIGVDDGSTTTSNKSPYATAGVEDGQLEGSTSLCVQIGNVSLLLGQLATERSRELHWWTSINGDLATGRGSSGNAEGGRGTGDGPLHTRLELGGLIELGSEIEEVNLCGGGILVGNDNERVDLEVAGELL